MNDNEPYVVVNASSVKRVKELYDLAGELLNQLQAETYSKDETSEENKYLKEQMDQRCDEKNDLWKEIMRLQLILDTHGIDYGMEDEDE